MSNWQHGRDANRCQKALLTDDFAALKDRTGSHELGILAIDNNLSSLSDSDHISFFRELHNDHAVGLTCQMDLRVLHCRHRAGEAETLPFGLGIESFQLTGFS